MGPHFAMQPPESSAAANSITLCEDLCYLFLQSFIHIKMINSDEDCYYCLRTSFKTMAFFALQPPASASVAAAANSITLCEDLGRLFLLDMILGNADRLPCADLGWRGNPGNILLGAQGKIVCVCARACWCSLQCVLMICLGSFSNPGKTL
jgi:hypothetical protein